MAKRKPKPTPKPRPKPKATGAKRPPPKPPKRPKVAAAPPPPPPRPDRAAAYDRHKAGAALRQREQSAAGRELGPLPAVADPVRRAGGEASLLAFLSTYFPEVFFLEWSPDHLELIAEMEAAILKGGKIAYAMERGSGKTAIAERAAIWAVLKGAHEFVALIGASGAASAELIDSIKTELDGNELLAADFPEVCFPIRELEGKPQRCAGQTFGGKRTYILWKRDMIVLPMIPGSKAAGVILKVASITGRVRGMKFTRPDGRIARPSLVLVDDFQTEKSAWSPNQCARRLKTINGTILKAAGPGVAITVIIPCTVIRKGDGADQLLDREKCPQFRGRRCKKLNAFPEKMDLWKRYAVLRAESLRAGRRGEEATEFYRLNRDEMDKGAKVAWPQRFDPDHLSALETSMVLYFEDRSSFMAECQNEPEDEERASDDLTPADLQARYSGRPRGVVPAWADLLTAFIDVQKTLLYYGVCAWKSDDFTGSCIRYGTWPEQIGRSYFTLADAAQTIQDALPGEALEAQIRRALDDCEAYLLNRDWLREDGTALRIPRLLKDSGYEMKTVFEQSRASRFAAVAMPSRGVPLGPGDTPMMDYKIKPGEKLGNHTLITTPRGFAVRWCKMDANYWKAFLVARLKQALGSPGAFTFHGISKAETDHGMLIDHLVAEGSHWAEAKGRKVRMFEQTPGSDNHWLDVLYGCAAAASVEGVTLEGQPTARAEPVKSWRQQQEEHLQRIGRRKIGRR